MLANGTSIPASFSPLRAYRQRLHGHDPGNLAARRQPVRASTSGRATGSRLDERAGSGSTSIRRSSPSWRTETSRPAPGLGHRGHARPGEHWPAVVAAEKRRRHVPHVPIHEPARGGTRAATCAPPSTRSCSTPRRPRSSSTAPRSPLHLERRRHAGTGRGRAEHDAKRLARSGRRSVVADRERGVVASNRAGADEDGIALGAKAVRRRARASGPVIQRLEPSGAAVLPSSVIASLRTTKGRPVARWTRYGRSWSLTSPASTPSGTSTARGLERSKPGPGDLPVRVSDAGDDTGDAGPDERARCTAASDRGGRRARGSHRPCRLELAPPAAARAAISACGPPGGAVAPSPTTSPAASTMTQPTHGLGDVVVRTPLGELDRSGHVALVSACLAPLLGSMRPTSG